MDQGASRAICGAMAQPYWPMQRGGTGGGVGVGLGVGDGVTDGVDVAGGVAVTDGVGVGVGVGGIGVQETVPVLPVRGDWSCAVISGLSTRW